MFAGTAPASARWLPVGQTIDCPVCASGYAVAAPADEAAPRSYGVDGRGQVWAWYPDRPYTRFDVEGTRVLERMR